MIEALPFRQELLEDLAAVRRQAVEALLAAAFLAPFAGQQLLGLEAAEQGVERALVDVEAEIGEGLSQP